MRRDFTDVRDAVRALRLLAQRGMDGDVNNVCSGRPVRVLQIAHTLLALGGLEAKTKIDAALARRAEPEQVIGNVSQLRASTGWRPKIRLRGDTSTAALAELGATAGDSGYRSHDE